MIGCFGKVSKEKILTNGFVASGSNLYLLGENLLFVGGSVAANVLNIKNTQIEKFDVQKYSNMLNCVLEANAASLLSSCSYVGLGGLATALFKMSFINDIGCDIEDQKDKNLLFSENLSFIVEVPEKNSSSFEALLNEKRCRYKQIGKTNDSNKIVVKNFIDLNINQTKKIWENALRKKLQ